MNRSFTVLAFTLMSLALASCESDELTTTNTQAPSLERKIILTPPHVEGEQYKKYTLKARIENMPISDIECWWDIGSGYMKSSWEIERTFNNTGIFYSRVKVFDIFTDSLLAVDSIRADIRPPIHFVDLVPKSIDTLLPMLSTGELQRTLGFMFTSSVPSHLAKNVWNFGDGSPEVTRLSGSNINHTFTGPGHFTVRLRLFDNANALIGSDTALVHIRMPEFSFADIEQATSVSVWLRLDGIHPVAQDSFYNDPFALRILIDKKSQFADKQFSMHYARQSSYEQSFDTIAGKFGSDLQTIEKLYVSVDDSGYLVSSPSGVLRYKFTLFDLDLLAVTPEKIVFRSTSDLLANFARDITFDAVSTFNHPRGYNSTAFAEEQKTGAHALVIFQRKQ